MSSRYVRGTGVSNLVHSDYALPKKKKELLSPCKGCGNLFKHAYWEYLCFTCDPTHWVNHEELQKSKRAMSRKRSKERVQAKELAEKQWFHGLTEEEVAVIKKASRFRIGVMRHLNEGRVKEALEAARKTLTEVAR